MEMEQHRRNGLPLILAGCGLAMLMFFIVWQEWKTPGRPSVTAPSSVVGEMSRLPSADEPSAATTKLSDARSKLFRHAMQTSADMISPDRAWELIAEATTTYVNDCDAITQRLYIKGLRGQPEKTLRKVVEAYDSGAGCIPPNDNARIPSEWTPLGWSASGDRVYMSRRQLIPVGDSEPVVRLLGNELIAVDVKSDVSTVLLGDLTQSNSEVLAVEARADRLFWYEIDPEALTLDGTYRYYVGHLDRSGAREVKLSKTLTGDNAGISMSVFSADGKRLAIMGFAVGSPQQSPRYRYFLETLDVEHGTNTLPATSPSDPSPWVLKGWSGERLELYTTDASDERAPIKVVTP